MRTVKRTRAAIAAAALATVALAAPASAGLLPSGGALAPVQPWLSQQLVGLDAATPTTVLVHGTDLAAAEDAVSAAGLRQVTTFDRIGVVVASGLPAQIQAVRASSGVTYVEGNQPIRMLLSTSNTATRGSRGARDPDRCGRHQPGRQGRLRRGHRLRRGPDPPVPAERRRHLRRGQEPQDGVRAADGEHLRAGRRRLGRHRPRLRRRARHARQRHRRRPRRHPLGRHQDARRRPGREPGRASAPARSCSSSARTRR